MTHPNPLLAAFLSALIPGLGQWYNGKRRRAWIFFAVDIVAILVALVIYSRGKLFVAKLFLDPQILIVFLILNAVGLGFRVIAMVDAFLTAYRINPDALGPRPAAVTAIGLAFLVLLTIYPHGYVGQRNLAAYDLLTYDFVTDPNQASTSTSTTDPSATSTTTDGSGTTQPGDSSTSSTSSSTTTTTTQPPSLWEGNERLNVLLMGGDAGPGRRGIRTDTMIIVSIDPDNGDTAMFSIPRNHVRYPIPEGHPAYDIWECHCFLGFAGLANEIYQYGLDNPDMFPGGPNSGANAIKTILGHGLGIDIHYFAMVNLEGFVDMIDALGGVTINVQQRVYDGEYPHEDGTVEVIDIAPGIQHLDGHLALAYARSRRTSDDYNRMGRQRCVLEALAEQADVVTLLQQFPTLVPIIQDSVLTDIPIRQLPELIELADKVDTERIVSVRFIPNAPEFAGTPTSYIGGWTEDRFPIPNVDLIRETVNTATTLSPEEAVAALNLQPLEDECGALPAG